MGVLAGTLFRLKSDPGRENQVERGAKVMVISELLKKLREITPPFQPYIKSKSMQYEEKCLHWNTRGVKQDALFYQFKSPSSESECTIKQMPDACSNIIFECHPDNPQAFFRGAALNLHELKLRPSTTYFGVKPYSTLGIKLENGFSVADLVDSSVKLQDVYTTAEELMIQLVQPQSFIDRINIFNKFSVENIINKHYQPTFIDYLTVMICCSKGHILFNIIEEAIGYSERYCRKIFSDTFNYSPKKYSSVMRFQNVLKNLLNPAKTKSFTDLAYDEGYFDQSHFIHDFKKYTNTTPENLKKDFL
jgi:AraC-like DNA-binding protein